jgi:hypothetical protein
MIDLYTLYLILKQVAIDLQPIRTFAVIDSPHQINQDNLGLSNHHALFGTYWSRDGISFDVNTAEFPAVIVENVKTSSIENIQAKKYTDQIYISIAQPEDFCDGVIEKIDLQNREYLKAYLTELSTYGLYQTDDGKVWLSEGRAKAMGINARGTSLYNAIEPNNSDIFTSGKGIDKMRMKSVMLSINTCVKVDIPVVYDQKDYTSGAIKCEVC